MKNMLGIVVSCIYIGIIIVSAKFFEKAGKEASRKYIHIMLSNWWIIAMAFFDNPIWASVLPFIFIIINYYSYKKDFISVMERSNQDGLGTVYYAGSLLFMTIYTFGIIKNPLIGLVSILIMGYGDGLACVIGRTVKSYEYLIGKTKKTIAGSATMLVVSFIILSVFLAYLGINLWYLKALILSIIITVIEAISIKGTDNLTVPIITSILVTFLV